MCLEDALSTFILSSCVHVGFPAFIWGFLRSCGGVTAHASDNEHTGNVGHLNASFVTLLHLIRVGIAVVL